jgi:hypothetical protein
MMEHVRYLAETIGPRGSTRLQEKQAADYVSGVLEEGGYTPVTETFTSARSSYYPYVLFAGSILLGEILFWAGSRLGAAAALGLTLFAIVSVTLELSFRPNPFRWLLPKGESQNVWLRIPSQGEPREQVVLLGHLDSNRTPLLFSSEGWVRFLGIIVPLGLTSALALAVTFILGLLSPNPLWRFLSLPFALVILVLFLLMVQADFSPFSAGANDNASAVAAVLEIAERLKGEPLAHTTVWALFSGCEEVGCYGAEAFVQAHRDELGCPVWMPLEILGGVGADPTYLTSETFLLTARSDPQLLALADQISTRFPEMGVYPLRWKSTYTEGAIGAKYGFRVLTIASFRRDGLLPEWHRPTDVVENVDPEVLKRSQAFAWELLRAIDHAAGQS